MFECQTLFEFPSGLTTQQHWDDLLERSPFPHIQATYGFTKAWWDSHRTTHELRLFLVTDQEKKLRLILPFCASKTKRKEWKTLATDQADYPAMIFEVGDTSVVQWFMKWVSKKSEWGTLTIPNIPFGDSVASALETPMEHVPGLMGKAKALIGAKYPLAFISQCESHPIIFGEGMAEVKNYLSRPSNQRNLRWFERHGDFNYISLEKLEDIEGLLPQFISLHRRDWANRSSGSQFEIDSDRDFILRLPRSMEAYRALRLDCLIFNSKLIAAHFGFSWRKRLYWYITCFDPDFHKRSPGRLLLGFVFLNAKEMGIEEFDLLHGREPYKDLFASDVRTTTNLKVFKSRWQVLDHLVKRRGRW